MILNELINIIGIDKNIDYNIEYYGNNITSKILIIYRYFIDTKNTMIIFTYSEKEAEYIHSSLSNIVDEVFLYPEIKFSESFINKSNDLQNISINILNNLLNNKKMILIITPKIILKNLKNPEDFSNSIINIDFNKNISFDELQDKLINIGYERKSNVYNIGEFSVRGSIIDIYSPVEKNPIRLDFFDSDLDSMKEFDINTQKSIRNIDKCSIYPTSEFFLSNDEKDLIVKKLKLILSNNYNISDQKLSKYRNVISNKINVYEESKIFNGLEIFSKLIYEKQSFNILNYIKENYVIIFDNYKKIIEEIKELKENLHKNLNFYEDRLEYNFEKELGNLKNNKIYLSTLSYNNTQNYNNLEIKDIPLFHNVKILAYELKIRLEKNYKILIIYNTNSQKEYIEKILYDYNLDEFLFNKIKESKICLKKSKFRFKGFEIEKNKFILITPRELFKKNKINSKKYLLQNSNSEKIRNYQDLEIGDYIVHIFHGIGIYKGIKNIKANGVYKDYLEVSYRDNDKIFVDIDNMKYIQKYKSSSDESRPVLSKLGTKKWDQTKKRVKKEIENISKELIKLYISREISRGFSFSKDNVLQQEFESDFLFIPTLDQLKVTEEIKKDMENEKPMDRLLCGDVGFGKTEVAMRIAFKAIMDNKQVAVLVPTTLLAKQHYDNFISRFANFPVNIDVVSRFKTKKEIDKIKEKLKNGEIDIIIGTHKLLHETFKYKDLGLLIIDEEHKFGVKHKEKIKKLKNTIDVLTLSATPIPRTMHMSLIGIRDLSIIETPPLQRHPIQTYIVEENEKTIRDAVLTEIQREGQIFYIFNNVEKMENKYYFLKSIVPEAKIAYSHGRMTKNQIEEILTDFIDRKYDILLTTTIIENGIDISNVNTLIVENADKFGLSQLYQLRGRVGRSSRIAYAYLMIKPKKLLNENSEKRLLAMKNFTSLGSGFRVAMQDLSIRGAGDMLGGKQHGFIDSVGYTLYSQMLEKEILEQKEIIKPIIKKDKNQNIEYYQNILKNNNKDIKNFFIEKEENNILMNLNVSAYIPKEYITSDADKLYFYKLITNSNTIEEINSINNELVDRYSNFPKEVDNLLNINIIRILSKNLMISKINENKKNIDIYFEKDFIEKIDGKLLFISLSNYDNLIVKFDKILKITLILKSNSDKLLQLINLFNDILSVLSGK